MVSILKPICNACVCQPYNQHHANCNLTQLYSQWGKVNRKTLYAEIPKNVTDDWDHRNVINGKSRWIRLFRAAPLNDNVKRTRAGFDACSMALIRFPVSCSSSSSKRGRAERWTHVTSGPLDGRSAVPCLAISAMGREHVAYWARIRLPLEPVPIRSRLRYRPTARLSRPIDHGLLSISRDRDRSSSCFSSIESFCSTGTRWTP